MKFFVFDTETTGFLVRGGRIDEQPHIIQFAGIYGEIDPATGNYSEITRVNEYIKPPVSIPLQSSLVNHIYDETVADAPIIADRIHTYMRYLNTTDVIVAHNIEYDEGVVSAELTRLGRDGEYQPVRKVCTMRASTDFCQLQGRGFSYKPPKLSELYFTLFADRFAGAHDAIVDVEATTRAFAELVKRKVIILEENKVMRLF